MKKKYIFFLDMRGKHEPKFVYAIDIEKFRNEGVYMSIPENGDTNFLRLNDVKTGKRLRTAITRGRIISNKMGLKTHLYGNLLYLSTNKEVFWDYNFINYETKSKR